MVTAQTATEATTLGAQAEAREVGTEQPLVIPYVDGDEAPANAEAVVEAASETETAAAASTPVATIDPSVAARLRRADELEEMQRQQEENTAINNEIKEVVEQAIRRGFSDEDAQWISGVQTATVRRLMNNFRQSLSQMEFNYGQRIAAYALAHEHGVDPQLLFSGRNPDEMREIARRELRYRDHEKRLRASETSRVTPQHLNRVGNSRAGGLAVTSENIDALHDQGRVSDATYRRFLATGQIR